MEKWNDIVLSLLDCKNRHVDEDKYQEKIEEQFKFLGWSIYNGCVERKPVLPVGNSNSLIPDVVLKKDGERVLPVEIKEPNNRLKKRQEEQLFSYMRQLDLRVGLYIGEKWQLYYNAPDDKENPHAVFTAMLDPDSEEGRVFCQLLTYESFSVISLEAFCAEKLEAIRFHSQIIEKLSKLNDNHQGNALLLSLLKNYLGDNTKYGDILDAELSKVNLSYAYGSAKKNSNVKVNVPSKKRKLVRYSLNGGPALPKTKLVLEAMRLYVEKHPDATFEDIETVFPKSIQGGYGVVRKFSELEEYVEAGSNIMGRFSSTPNELLTSADGIRFAVCNQWEYNNFPRFVNILKELKWRVKEIK